MPPIDPLTGPKYILEGRLVTMGPAGVIEDGAIYIDKGTITAVQGTDETVVAGFANVPRVRTGDTIYPGLIELHNHLSYNAMPLWHVPQAFTNNGQWKNHPDYRRLITKPSQALGRTEGVMEALVRFVECRAMLGGTTTSQGITLASAGGLRSFYKGIVRNVEQTDETALPRAGTKIANPSTGQAEKYLTTLKKNTCYLQHLSEGVDDTARGWFHRLQISSERWALNESFCGIHSTALEQEQLELIADHGGSMVWSPLSNYLLYGDTVDLAAAKASGIVMGIGCDWAPSGSKNLLGELKVAWLANKHAGEVFSAQQIVEMATINPARILKWDEVLGSIEPGKRADLIAINGQQGDVYEQLIEARETGLTLVVINGVPRVGQSRIMAPFGAGTESIHVGSSKRVLNLAQATSHPLVGKLSLAEAISRLKTAMENLPELARDLDAATGAGVFSGSADPQGTRWQVAFEFDDDEPDLAGAALPLADFVQPMDLDPITVADDALFLSRLAAAHNLPDFVKAGLPPMYGKSIPLPGDSGSVRDEIAPGEVVDLRGFLASAGGMSTQDRLTIVDQALLVLEHNYVHLPLKRAMHAADPIQELKLLRHRITEDPTPLPSLEFHSQIAGIFASLRDLHTTYSLPAPYRGKVAWLPFIIEECFDHGIRHYVVTKVIGDAGPSSFQPGVEVSYWNGTPIETAVRQNAERQAGSNPAARHARGLNSLTLRPLASGLPPQEEWVTLRYRDKDGDHEYQQEWLLFEPGRSSRSLGPESEDPGITALGLDPHTDDIQEAKRVLFAGHLTAYDDPQSQAPVANGADALPTFLPTLFRARPIQTETGEFGHIRIFTFNVNDPQAFVDEFVRLIKLLPKAGLIVDVRGNGGGHIHAAERILQTLTAHRIEPERTQFVNSPLNLRLCRAHAPSTRFSELDLKPWIRSMSDSVRTGATYSLGYPITPREACNDIGRQYDGPSVLITDALCYSATDIFAAGFQDHEIGKVLGVHENTGAGGANVWTHTLLRRLLEGQEYVPLPRGADLRVAVRRTIRVGKNAGGIVEDLGIQPDHAYQMHLKDILENNDGVLKRAARLLTAEH